MEESKTFPVLGMEYTRAEISVRLGGGIQRYLPSVKGQVVAICVDPKKNPEAPGEILVGTGPQIIDAGKALTRQGDTLPVFLKQESKRWRFIGHDRVSRWSDDPGVIEEKRRPGDGITRVIYLERTEADPEIPPSTIETGSDRETASCVSEKGLDHVES